MSDFVAEAVARFNQVVDAGIIQLKGLGSDVRNTNITFSGETLTGPLSGGTKPAHQQGRE